MLLYANVDETDSLICSDSGCKLCETQRGRCVRIGEVKLDLRRYFLEHFFGRASPSCPSATQGRESCTMCRCVGWAEVGVELGRCTTPGQTHQLHQGLTNSLDPLK